MTDEQNGCGYGRVLAQKTEGYFNLLNSGIKGLKDLFNSELQQHKSDIHGLEQSREDTKKELSEVQIMAEAGPRAEKKVDKMWIGIIMICITILVGSLLGDLLNAKHVAKADITTQNTNQVQTMKQLDEMKLILQSAINKGKLGGK